MKGHIRKKDSTWQYTVELDRDPISNKRKQKSKGGFRTKRECEKAMAEMIVQIEQGEYFESKETLLKDYLHQWLEAIKNNISEGTFVFYNDIVDKIIIPKLGLIKINKLTPLSIQNFLTSESKNKSGTTVRHYYNVLNISLNRALKWQLIQVNPCNAVETPKKSQKKIKVLSPEESNNLLEYTQSCIFEVMYIPVLLALTCGMRRGEILGLKWDNINFEKNILVVKNNLQLFNGTIKLTVPKTDKSARTIALLPSTIKILKEHKKNQLKQKLLHSSEYNDENFVCCWEDGRPIRPDYITQTFKKIIRHGNFLDVSFHDLRHTHATLQLLKGVNPKIVSERLGHSRINMTLDTYSHVLPEMQQQAVEKLAEIFKYS